MKCCVPNCKNTGGHLFPKDPKRRHLWEKAINRGQNFRATDTSRLCSAHFKQDDYFGQSRYTCYEPLAKFLRKTAVPTIFNFTNLKPVSPQSEARQQNAETTYKSKLDLNDRQTQDTSTCSEQLSDLHLLKMDIQETKEIYTSMDKEKVHCVRQSFSSIGTQVSFAAVYGSIDRFKSDDEGIYFYTGFESYEKFHLVYSTLSPFAEKNKYIGSTVINLTTENQFFLCMMKLRQDTCLFELSRFFNVSANTASNIFITWVNFMYRIWSKIYFWPNEDFIEDYMPEHFKKYSKHMRVHLDEKEIYQKQTQTTFQQLTWSSYKHSNSLKVLVGGKPIGLPSYCSKTYARSISDRQILGRSNLTNNSGCGDTILADRGFKVQDIFAHKNLTVKKPARLKGKSELGLIVLQDRHLASKRVHIERLMGLAKTYKILINELSHSFIPIVNKIFFVCCISCNFQESAMTSITIL